MRVLLAPSAFSPHRGGVEELTLKLAQSLQRRGHEVQVVTHRWPKSLVATELVEGVDVTRLDFTAPGRRARALRRHAVGSRLVARALDAMGRFDVVHVICPSSQTGHVTSYARRRRTPLVLTSQGEVEMDAGGLYQRSAYARYQFRRAARQASVLTACSSWARDAATQVSDRFRTAEVVLNGLDLADWMVTPPAARPVIAAWGRHVPQKGFDLLLEAFPLVREELPDAELRLGGDGPEWESLQARAGPGVHLLGPLDRPGVADLLRVARIVAVPSRLEPFGIVALEAAASGRTVVYSVHGGLGEALDGVGIGVDPLDRTALATALVRALRDPLPSLACRRVAARLTWTELSATYARLYDRAAAECRS